VEEARRRGVRARFALDSGLVASLNGETVLAAARHERAGMIAMPSMSGPVARMVAGSVAQEVIRAGKMLVWLYGPRTHGAGLANAA
jgi:hypothetical protein